MITDDRLDNFFAGQTLSKELFEAVRQAVTSIGETSIRVSKSQIAFRHHHNFAMVWMPGQYLKRHAPLVLTISLRRRDKSPRWKEIVEPIAGRFTHHLELNKVADVDGEVRDWLREAWAAA